MTLKELIKQSGLTQEDLTKDILFSNDEELNCLYTEGRIAYLEDLDKLVIYPLTGSEVEL